MVFAVITEFSQSLRRQDRIEEQKNALEKSERDLRFAMPRNVATGLDAVERLVREQVRENGLHLRLVRVLLRSIRTEFVSIREQLNILFWCLLPWINFAMKFESFPRALAFPSFSAWAPAG